MKTWEVKCKLLSYVKFDRSVIVESVNFYKDEDNRQYAGLTVEADSSNSAREQAKVRVNKSSLTLFKN